MASTRVGRRPCSSSLWTILATAMVEGRDNGETGGEAGQATLDPLQPAGMVFQHPGCRSRSASRPRIQKRVGSLLSAMT